MTISDTFCPTLPPQHHGGPSGEHRLSLTEITLVGQEHCCRWGTRRGPQWLSANLVCPPCLPTTPLTRTWAGGSGSPSAATAHCSHEVRKQPWDCLSSCWALQIRVKKELGSCLKTLLSSTSRRRKQAYHLSEEERPSVALRMSRSPHNFPHLKGFGHHILQSSVKPKKKKP